MSLERGSTFYELFDTEDPTKINWNSTSSSGFESDRLEKIIHTELGRTQTFSSQEENNGTIRGQNTKEAIDKATAQYNSNRKQIYEEKRNQENARIERARRHIG